MRGAILFSAILLCFGLDGEQAERERMLWGWAASRSVRSCRLRKPGWYPKSLFNYRRKKEVTYFPRNSNCCPNIERLNGTWTRWVFWKNIFRIYNFNYKGIRSTCTLQKRLIKERNTETLLYRFARFSLPKSYYSTKKYTVGWLCFFFF